MSEDKKESTALVPHTSGLALRTMADHKEFGMALFHAGLVDGDKNQAVAKAVVAIQCGAELGVGPMSSIRGIFVMDGKPVMSAGLMSALIKKSERYDYRVTEHTAESCTIDFLDRGKVCGTSSFSIADAKQAGISFKTQKGYPTNWAKFPRNMVFARALSNGAKWYCPDLFSGAIYTPDEIGSNAIEADFAPIDPPPEYDKPRPGEVIDAEMDESPPNLTSAEAASGIVDDAAQPRAFAEYDGGPTVKMLQRMTEYANLDAVPSGWKMRIRQRIEQAKAGQLRKGEAGKILAAVKKLLQEQSSREVIDDAKQQRDEDLKNSALWAKLAGALRDDAVSDETKKTIKHLFSRQQKNDEPSAVDLLESIAAASADRAKAGETKPSADDFAIDELKRLMTDKRADDSVRNAILSAIEQNERGNLESGAADKLLADITGYFERLEDPDFDGGF